MILAPLPAKTKLLSAAMKLFRARGYDASTVDALCCEAGVTKGAFFHYFRSKEELAVAAVAFWNEWLEDLFRRAPYNQIGDPLERLFGYIDFRAQLLSGANLEERSCLLGTLAQETFLSHPAIREACGEGIAYHAAMVQKLVEDAKARYAPDANWSAESLAMYIQAVIQGAFIVAKAQNRFANGVESFLHLRRYLEMLFRNVKNARS